VFSLTGFSFYSRVMWIPGFWFLESMETAACHFAANFRIKDSDTVALLSTFARTVQPVKGQINSVPAVTFVSLPQCAATANFRPLTNSTCTGTNTPV